MFPLLGIYLVSGQDLGSQLPGTRPEVLLTMHLLKACDPLLCGCTRIQLVTLVCSLHIGLHVCHVTCLEMWRGLGEREHVLCGLQTNVLGGWWGIVLGALACNMMPQ